MFPKLLRRALLVAVVLTLATPFIALAHTEVKVGPYTLEVGWVDEPPLVGLKNAVYLNVKNSNTNQPVEGVSTLEVTVATGGKEQKLDVHPLGENTPGEYAADFIPTRRGVYTVKLSGKIENTDVNTSVDIEEVAPASSLMFPEPLPDPQSVQDTANRIEATANNASTLATIALIVAILGLLLGGVAVLRSRKS